MYWQAEALVQIVNVSSIESALASMENLVPDHVASDAISVASHSLRVCFRGLARRPKVVQSIKASKAVVEMRDLVNKR
jgi:hypothetical protein